MELKTQGKKNPKHGSILKLISCYQAC